MTKRPSVLHVGDPNASSVCSSSVPGGFSGVGRGPSASVPPIGRNELCVNEVGMSAFGTPPPAYAIGSHAVASRNLPLNGSRCHPRVQ